MARKRLALIHSMSPTETIATMLIDVNPSRTQTFFLGRHMA